MWRRRALSRARALVGTRFRPQGRSAEHGLDCIGVVIVAMDLDAGAVRRDYGLLGNDRQEVEAEFDDCGFVRIAPAAAREADILLVRAGPRQLHVVILTDEGYLHADAGLRRVVEVPGAVPWPVLSAWQHPEAWRERTAPRGRVH